MIPSEKGPSVPPVAVIRRGKRLSTARSARQYVARLIRDLDAGLVPAAELENVRVRLSALRLLIDCIAQQRIEDQLEVKFAEMKEMAERTLAAVAAQKERDEEGRRVAALREESLRALAAGREAQAKASEPVPDGED